MPERPYKHIDIARSPTSVASVEHVLRGAGGDSARFSPTYSSNCSSPSSPWKQQDAEEDHGLYQKRSVLTKVKQKARKFCNSLSKRRMEDENVTPPWGARLEDDEEEEEEDPEYLGAPMYESELAPEAYKENARQHPRANPVISEKHVLHNNIRLGMQQDREKPRASINHNLKSMTQLDTTIATTRTSSPNKASETLADKLIPVYAGGSLAANSVSSKIQSAVSKHPLTANTMPSQNASASSSRLLNSPSLSASQSRKNTTQNGASMDNYLMNKSVYEEDAKTMSPKQDLSSSSASLGGKYAQKGVSLRNNSMNRYEQGNETRTMTPLQKSSSFSAASMSGKNTSQKGASTKDYSLSRFERMDNERTASQLQGPSRSSSNAGMMDKVRGAVNSLLGNEEPSQTQQGDEDENRGRILQAN
ncbi:hypothetical protein PHAVU_L008043 [Phaseolus vulgaris]|uniref:LTI65/LTI78 N-terminal domain-containing protein n=2 Tax=Phaseolus vulgaris TaxID=3885 RepID=V7BZ21_PHAVU|nr:hypothetical protein PHAVU_005G146500g [Phaseolus vulgaris]ESW22348.1 hypothetical protein PHAVU_005G146500g [Phaseolus vulgaris]